MGYDSSTSDEVAEKEDPISAKKLKLGAKVTAKVHQVRARGLVLDLGNGIRGMYRFEVWIVHIYCSISLKRFLKEVLIYYFLLTKSFQFQTKRPKYVATPLSGCFCAFISSKYDRLCILRSNVIYSPYQLFSCRLLKIQNTRWAMRCLLSALASLQREFQSCPL